MATRIVVASEDDLDGDPAAETSRFTTRGLEYEIDLSKKNARKLWKRLALFIEHARKAERGQCYRPARTQQIVSATSASGCGRKPAAPGQAAMAIRRLLQPVQARWCRSRGHGPAAAALSSARRT